MHNRDSPVYQDYKENREFDATKQAKRYTTKAIIVSILAVLTPLVLLGKFTTTPALILLYLEIILAILVMGPIMFYFLGRNQTKMNMAHQGYDINWTSNREQIFGTDTHHIIRADPGNGQAAIVGLNNNPFSVSKRTLQKIEKKQREDSQCETCGNQMFTERIFDEEGGYFVEERKRYWMFGLPIKEKIIGWDSYCPEHKPKPENYTNSS